MKFHFEDLEPLAEAIIQVTGIPLERLAFAVVVATYDDEGRPSGRLLTSTSDMRGLAQMLDMAQDEVGRELDNMTGTSWTAVRAAPFLHGRPPVIPVRKGEKR